MENKEYDEYLYNLLEKIVFKDFQDEDSGPLKAAINKLHDGNIDTQKFKKLLLESRVIIFEQLLKVFPFYHDRILQKDQLTKNMEVDEEMLSLRKELNEKDGFLGEIGERVNKIFETFCNNNNKAKAKT